MKLLIDGVKMTAEEKLKKAEEGLKKTKKELHGLRWFILLGLLFVLVILIWGITTKCTPTSDPFTWICPW